MNRWKEHWEIKVMAVLLAVLLWLALRIDPPSTRSPSSSPEVGQHG